MAGKIFYGTSETIESTEKKVVTIISTEENPTLTEGDVLVVLFSDGNTKSSPKIDLQNGSLSDEISVTDDAGIDIRVYSNEEYNLTTAWVGGEAKIFVLAKDSMDVYFFEMLGSIRGDGTIFGNTKIVDEIGQQPQGAQDNTALSPLGVKNYVNAQTNLSLDWDSETGSSSGVVLGYLSLQRGEEGSEESLGDPVTIYYPKSEIQSISKTSDIINDGPKYESQLTATNANNYFGWEKPFLTKFIPNRIYIYGTNNTEDHDNSKIGIYSGITNGHSINGRGRDEGRVFVIYSGNNHNVDIYNPYSDSTDEKNGMISLNPAKNGWVRIGEDTNYGGKLWVREDAVIQGTLTVQNLTIKGGLNYTGNQTFNNLTTFSKLATFNNGMNISGKNSQNYGLYVRESIKTNGDLIIDASSRLSSKLEITDGYDTFTTIDTGGITISASILNASLNINGLQLCNSSILKHVCTTVITLTEDKSVCIISDPRLKSSDQNHPILGVIVTLQDPPDTEIGIAHVRNNFTNGKMTLKFTKTMPKNKPFRINYLIIQ